jgi:hypothetical protein
MGPLLAPAVLQRRLLPPAFLWRMGLAPPLLGLAPALLRRMAMASTLLRWLGLASALLWWLGPAPWLGIWLASLASLAPVVTWKGASAPFFQPAAFQIRLDLSSAHQQARPNLGAPAVANLQRLADQKIPDPDTCDAIRKAATTAGTLMSLSTWSTESMTVVPLKPPTNR